MAGGGRFAHAIALQQFATAETFKLTLGSGGQGRGTADTGAYGFETDFAGLNSWMLVQCIKKGRNCMKQGRLVGFDHLNQLVDLARVYDQRNLTADVDAFAEDGDHAEDMKHRQRTH